MRKKLKRVLSGILIFTIMVSTLFMQAIAIEPDLSEEEFDLDLEGYEQESDLDLEIPDGHTIILPILQERRGSSVRGLSLQSRGGYPLLYMPIGANHTYRINGRFYIESEPTEPKGLLQIINAHGDPIASSHVYNDYKYDEEMGKYYIEGNNFEILDEIEVGIYFTQLVVGDEIIAGLSQVECTDSPFISSAYIEEFYEGATSIEIQVSLYGFYSEAQLESLTFSLLDDNDKVIAQSKGEYRNLNLNSGYVTGYTRLSLIDEQTIERERSYNFAITYSGEGTLVDGTGGLVGHIPTPKEEIDFKITNLYFSDPQKSKVIVEAKNLDSNTEYTVTISDSNRGNSYLTTIANGGDFPLEVQLTNNGITVPATFFNTSRFYVTINDGLNSQYESFDNPYYNIESEREYISFNPNTINPNTVELPFSLDMRDCQRIYSGGTDFTIIIKDDQHTLATLHGSDSTVNITREGTNYLITGTISFNGSLSNSESYDIYFNDEHIDTIYVTDKYRAIINILGQDHQARSFWTILDKLFVSTDIINSSGRGKLELRDESDNIVAASETLQGDDSQLHGYKTYIYTFSLNTQDLNNGDKYSVIFVDEGANFEEYILMENYTFDSDYSFEPYDDLYFLFYDLVVGDDSVQLRLYGEAKNIKESDLVDWIGSLTINSKNGDTIKFQGVEASIKEGYFKNHGYNFNLQLSNKLKAGEYTITSNKDKDFSISYFIDKSEEVPRIYSANLESGYIYGVNLPTNASYSGKLYDGYTSLTEAAFLLMLGEAVDGKTQYLYIPNDIKNQWNPGNYQLRVYINGEILDAVDVIISDDKLIVDVYDPINNSYYGKSDLVIESGYVAFKVIGGKYNKIRFSEDQNGLESVNYTDISQNYRYQLSEGNGKKTLYVQLKNREGIESEIITLTIWRQSSDNGLIRIFVDESIQGVYTEEEITFVVGAESPVYNAYVDFVDSDGNIKTAQLSYTGVGNAEDGEMYLYTGTFKTKGFNSGYGYLGYIDDTLSVRFYMTGKSNANQPGELKSEVVERVLVFGELTNIIMPQFRGYRYLTNSPSIKLHGFATPNSTVTLTGNLNYDYGSDIISETVTANNHGYFIFQLNDIAEGDYNISVEDNSYVTLRAWGNLTVDRTAPIIEKFSFKFLDNNNVVINWKCEDKDVLYYELYKNYIQIKTIPNYDLDENATEFTYNLVANRGDVFNLVAVDEAGNRGIENDNISPTVPGKPTISSRISTSITFSWDASRDNVVVSAYDIYRNDKKIGSVDGSINSYTDSGLEMNTKYRYKIKARDGADNESEFSEEVELSTANLGFVPEKTIKLNEVYILEEQIDKKIFVNTAVLSDEYYAPKKLQVLIQYKLSSEENWENCSEDELISREDMIFEGYWSVAGNTEGYIEPNTYDLRFKISDEGGSEGFSHIQVVNLKWDDISPDIKFTNPISNQTYGGGKTINVYGISSDNVGVDKVRLSYSYDNEKFVDIEELINNKIDGSSKLFNWDYNWQTKELQSGSIILKAIAYDSRENSKEATLNIKLDNIPPEVPKNLSVNGDNEKITVMWSYPPQNIDSDFSHFKVYRSTREDGDFICVKDNLFSIGYYDDIDTGILPNKLYYYYVIAVDKYGNESKGTNIASGQFTGDPQHPMPVAPILSASNNGHKQVLLSWIYNGDTATLSNFKIYRSIDGVNYDYVVGAKASSRSIVDYVTFSGESQTYNYKIVVENIYGKKAESNIATITAISNDNEKPVPIIGPENLALAEINIPFGLTAAASTDNDEILSYEWDFGDGSVATGIDVFHIYKTKGVFNVTLTVTDAYNNSAKTTKEIMVVELEGGFSEYTRLNLIICDGNTLDAIPNAEVSISKTDKEDMFTDALKSDENGRLSFIVPNGDYLITVMANDYIVRTIAIKASGKENGVDPVHKIGLTKGGILGGELTFKEMTYDEIVAVGIDVNDPNNQQVYKFALNLEFVAGIETWELPFTLYKNKANELLTGYGGWGFQTLGEGIGGGNGFRVGVFPISEKFLLVIYGEARWLKEMYNVELIVINNSMTDTIENCKAQLILPEGLSLANMTSGAQSDIQELGTIGHNNKKIARWYVRGDKEGEYNITAKVNALTMPYGEEIQNIYTTETPLKVYAGSALKMTIIADDMAKRGEDYRVIFRLTNVSHKPIYNLSFGITGIEQFKVLRMGTKEVNLPLDKQDFEDSITHMVNELAPGGYFEIEISTTIWFNSILELIELTKVGGFVDIAYYLTNSSMITMEGSTTEIPYEIIINPVDRPNILRKLYEMAKKLYGKDGDGEFEGTIGEAIIEVFGYELPAYLKKGASSLISLQKGSSNTKARITIDNGKGEGNSIYNDYISITTGSQMELIYDIINGAQMQIKGNGDFSIKGLKSGESTINISIIDDDLNIEYKIPIKIDDKEINTTIDVNKNLDDGTFTVEIDLLEQIINSIREKEKATYEKNPYLFFTSYFGLNLVGSNSEIGVDLELDRNIIEDLVERTLVSNLGIENDVANLVFDKKVLESILDASSNEEAIKIFIKKLGEEVAKEKFGVDNDTYELLLQVGEDILSYFSGGEVEVSIPYTLKKGETTENIQVYRMGENGSKKLLKSEYDSTKGLVIFTTDGFSYYQISHKTIEKPHDKDTDEDKDKDEDTDKDKEKDIDKETSKEKVTEYKNPDGSKTTTVTRADGTVGKTTIDKNGNLNSIITISPKATQDNRPVELPIPEIILEKDIRITTNLIIQVPSKGATVNIPIYGDSFVEINIRNGVYSKTMFVKGKEGKIQMDLIGGENEITITKTKEPPFIDVKASEWYYEPISYAYHYGLFNGVSEREFSPNLSMSRAMLVTVLKRYEDVEKVYPLEGFIDVGKDEWYSHSVAWALEKGIVSGYGNGIFGPNEEITREQVALILYNYGRYKSYNLIDGVSSSSFADGDDLSPWAKTAMEWAIAEKLFQGKGNGMLDPKGKITRAEVATLLQRFIENIAK